MSHQANVRSVVVGGLPQPGPMQAVSGSRGAIAYDAYTLDSKFALASLANQTAAANLPQVRDPGMYVLYAGFNLRDQIRPNDTTPLQFKYEAADCRIFYTLKNALNETRLWLDAAAAIWTNPELCVQGSTGYTSRGNSTVAPKPPPQGAISTLSGNWQRVSQANSTIIHAPDDGIWNGLEDSSSSRGKATFQTCDQTCDCRTKVQCPGGGTVSLCTLQCDPGQTVCGGGLGLCVPGQSFDSKYISTSGFSGSQPSKSTSYKICQPRTDVNFEQCAFSR